MRAASCAVDRSRAERRALTVDHPHIDPMDTLSGLALQSEGANLLATSTPADPRLADTVKRAHQLFTNELAEARGRGTGRRSAARTATDPRRGRRAPARQLRLRQVRRNRPPGAAVPEAGRALYRATKEALTNVRKHAVKSP